jgi:hypothetical protein
MMHRNIVPRHEADGSRVSIALRSMRFLGPFDRADPAANPARQGDNIPRPQYRFNGCH